MKNKLLYLLFLITIGLSHGQTNVSGGIFNNTTWNIEGSPYIVTADMAIFPGYTLTIEPGVIIKFNEDIKLIIRGKLLASGSDNNKIVFTSNLSNPIKGSWKGIEIENDQGGEIIASNILGEYANSFIKIINSTYSHEVVNMNDSEIKNCFYAFYGYEQPPNFFPNRNKVILNKLNVNNNTYAFIYAENFTITNSIFSDGEKGISGVDSNAANPSISNSEFFNFSEFALDFKIGKITESHLFNNGVGIRLGKNLRVVNSIIELNVIGVEANFQNQYLGLFSNNQICNNSQYNFKHTNNYPIDLTNNFWCTNIEADISQSILDAYDNVALGIANFRPFYDTFVTLSNETFKHSKKDDLIFYPNPVTNEISFFDDSMKNFEIYSINGRIIKRGIINNDKLNLSDLSKGIYMIRVFDSSNIRFSIKKLIKN